MITSMRKKLGILFCCALFSSCTSLDSTSGRKVALIRAQDVTLLTVNGTILDTESRAVLVVAGRNELTFRWPVVEDGFQIPTEYRLIMQAEPSGEYVITPHPKSGFLCAWKAASGQGIDFTRHTGCVQRQPS